MTERPLPELAYCPFPAQPHERQEIPPGDKEGYFATLELQRDVSRIHRTERFKADSEMGEKFGAEGLSTKRQDEQLGIELDISRTIFSYIEANKKK